jgi:hypothetical protein
VIQQTTAALVENLERAVDFVVKDRDPDIHRLVAALRDGLLRSDWEAMRRTAAQIIDHATFRYAAVVEQADRLLRHLDEIRENG